MRMFTAVLTYDMEETIFFLISFAVREHTLNDAIFTEIFSYPICESLLTREPTN